MNIYLKKLFFILMFFTQIILANDVNNKKWKLFKSEPLENIGLNIDGSLIQFYQTVESNDAEKNNYFGGLIDLKFTQKLSTFGFSSNTFLSISSRWIYGNDANNAGDGSVLPINTALGFPRLSGRDFDFTNFSIINIFDNGNTLMLGKIDMLELASQTPLIGGGGKTGFNHLAFAAPPSGLVSPIIHGMISTIKTRKNKWTIGIYDTEDATTTDINDSFKDIGAFLSLSFTSTMNKRLGIHTFSAKINNKTGLDLSSLPDIGLPSESENVLGDKNQAWNISYSFQQYLWNDPVNTNKGWGVFGQIGRSDGNPTPIDWSVFMGLAGNFDIFGRSKDKLGFGYFHFSLSNELIDGLDVIAEQGNINSLFLKDESGLEIFYEAKINETFSITANYQYINPHERLKSNSNIFGIRAHISF